MNSASGFVSIQPSAPYTASLQLVATDGLESAVLLEWNYQSFPADTALDPTHGPNGGDCLNGGQRFDGVRYDGRFTCDCTVVRYQGSNCGVPVITTDPQLLVENTGQQSIPDGDTASGYTFYNRTTWAWGRTTSSPRSYSLRRTRSHRRWIGRITLRMCRSNWSGSVGCSPAASSSTAALPRSRFGSRGMGRLTCVPGCWPRRLGPSPLWPATSRSSRARPMSITHGQRAPMVGPVSTGIKRTRMMA
jgi:hypothetical protein